jgi:hypothetical protein
MSEYLVTTCSKEKDPAPGLLPAIERYRHARIDWVYLESRRLNIPMLILSGEFGLLLPTDPIPWYDHALQVDEVQDLVLSIAKKLEILGADRLRFYARPASEPGWAPYHAALTQASREASVRLKMISW